VYAVIENGGKQYRITVGQTLDVELLPTAAGEKVTIERVLMVADDNGVKVGQPTVRGASVSATVVEHGLRRKAIVFNFRPKQRYRVKTGHRQRYTRLHIDEIKF
jgi:large subunit ribosomal protein L21